MSYVKPSDISTCSNFVKVPAKPTKPEIRIVCDACETEVIDGVRQCRCLIYYWCYIVVVSLALVAAIIGVILGA
jgi:hypothetical protein